MQLFVTAIEYPLQFGIAILVAGLFVGPYLTAGVNAGAVGAVVLLASNSFGYSELQSGTLKITNDFNLGVATGSGLVLKGGALAAALSRGPD